MLRLILIIVILGVCPLGAPLRAQATASDTSKQAAATITPATLGRQVAVLMADSLQDRATPSAALARTARYVVTEFENFTALPPSLQLYPLPGRTAQLDPVASVIRLIYELRSNDRAILAEDGTRVSKIFHLPLTTAARLVVPRVSEIQDQRAPSVALLTGQPTAAFLQQADLTETSVLYIPPADLDTTARKTILEALYRAGRGAVLLAVEDSADFAMQQESRTRQPVQIVDAYLDGVSRHGLDDAIRPWVAEVRADAVTELLMGLGVDLAQAQAARAPTLRQLPQLEMRFSYRLDTMNVSVPPAVKAPNVAMKFEGSDSVLERQCIMLVAPLDQRGSGPRTAGSVTSGTDPSTVSLAGLLELVRAFDALPVLPRRSIVFLAASGGGPGQGVWGSQAYLYDRERKACSPVLSLTLDLNVGDRVAGDTAVLGGMDDVMLATPPAWIAAAHPELGLTVADGGPVTRAHSDAFAFAQRGYPSLVLQRGPLADSAADPPSPAALDLERTVRLLQLIFYIAYDAANSPERPRWSTADRQRRSFGQP